MKHRIKLTDEQLAELKSAAEKHPLALHEIPIAATIGLAMRCACPVLGCDWDKFMTVLLQPGESISSHQHKRHTILYYPEDCEPVVVNGEVIEPKAGQIMYMEPGVVHHVPKVTRTRLSVAMQVSE
jgi:hypothetical protein